jgi:hypothetical protein
MTNPLNFRPPADRKGRRPAKPDVKPFTWYEIAADAECEQSPENFNKGPPLVEGKVSLVWMQKGNCKRF